MREPPRGYCCIRMNLMLRRSRETELEKHINGIKYAVFLKLTPLKIFVWFQKGTMINKREKVSTKALVLPPPPASVLAILPKLPSRPSLHVLS